MRVHRINFGVPALGLFLTSLSCRPVLTVGWQELFILILVVVVLLGPALWKLYRRIDAFRAWHVERQSKDEDG